VVVREEEGWAAAVWVAADLAAAGSEEDWAVAG
jgi:hypothetical protein